jgi:hypothetical protein
MRISRDRSVGIACRLFTVGEGGFDAVQVQPGDNPPPLPAEFPPEIAKGLPSVLVRLLHLVVGVVEHEDPGRLGIGHGVAPFG